MDAPFQDNIASSILPTIFMVEDIYRSEQLQINPYDYFPNTLQNLHQSMSSPLFSASDMTYCAREIERLYPKLKPAERTQFETLNNRIKLWKETRSNPAARIAKVENLPAYAGKKFKLFEDLITIFDFEEILYSKFKKIRTICQDGNEKAATALLNEAISMPPPVLDMLKDLKELFPELEFILQNDNQKERPFLTPLRMTQFKILTFCDAYKEIREDQALFKNYVKALHLEKFRTFEDLIKILKENHQEELKKVFNFETFEEFLYRLSSLLPVYTLSDNEWNVLTERLNELYPTKNRTPNQKILIGAFNETFNPKLLASKEISYECCSIEPSQRIPTSTTLEELNQLVSHLQLEVSVMSHIDTHLINSKKTLTLFASKQKNSMPSLILNKMSHTGYLISMEELSWTLPESPYVKICHFGASNYIFLRTIEKKSFNHKAIFKSLDSLIKKSSSPTLTEIFQSMKAHVELICLVKANRLDTDLQDYLKSLKKSSMHYALTPFLNDAGSLIQFFPPQPITPEFFNNPTPPAFLEANQAVLEKIHEGWNQNKHHQKLLLDYAQKQITALKKANQTSRIQKIKPKPAETPPPVKKDKKVTPIKTPKILKAPIAVAKALIQGTPTPPPFQIPRTTTLQVHASPPIWKLTQPPPGKPFAYMKTQRVLDWEHHPIGKELPKGVFSEKYTKLPLDIQEKIHLFHFPHPAVDLFLHMGIEGKWDSNRRVDIIAEIKYNQTTFKGVIGYTFDGNECYHRCFTERLEEDLAALRANHLKQQEFPPLETAASRLPGRAFYPDLECSISHDPLGNVIIKHTTRDVSIKLFKI